MGDMIRSVFGAALLSLTSMAMTPAANAADLIELYDLARQQDPLLLVARSNRDAVRESRPIALSRLRPNVSGTGNIDYTNQDIRDSSVLRQQDDNFTSGDLGVQVTQPIYRRDRSLQLEQADVQAEQADADYESAEQDLMLRVSEAYFSVLSAQDDLKFTKKQLSAIERQLDQAKQQFEVGLIAITGVHEAQARYDQTRADEISALNAVDNAWERLREIVGQTTETIASLEKELTLEFPAPAKMQSWSEIAMDNSPTIASARYGTEIARKEIEVQRSGHYPTLDAVGSYSLTRSNAEFSTESNNAQVGLQLAVPIYTSGGVDAATRQAQFRFQAAQDTLDQARRSVDRQVRDAYRGIESSIHRVKALKTTTVSAQSALDATEAGYEVGTRTLVDVLNSQSTLFSADRDYANSRYDYILNNLRLRQGAGVLGREDLENVSKLLQP